MHAAENESLQAASYSKLVEATSDSSARNVDIDRLKSDHLLGETRLVTLKRVDPGESLGVSITGGNEHGVPIIVSEIHDNGPAARSGRLFVGDAILTVSCNKKRYDLKEVMHAQAVDILSSLKVLHFCLVSY